jgi:hypothetical protein
VLGRLGPASALDAPSATATGTDGRNGDAGVDPAAAFMSIVLEKTRPLPRGDEMEPGVVGSGSDSRPMARAAGRGGFATCCASTAAPAAQIAVLGRAGAVLGRVGEARWDPNVAALSWGRLAAAAALFARAAAASASACCLDSKFRPLYFLCACRALLRSVKASCLRSGGCRPCNRASARQGTRLARAAFARPSIYALCTSLRTYDLVKQSAGEQSTGQRAVNSRCRGCSSRISDKGRRRCQ